MRILVTGADGFVGKNLVESLKSIRDGKDRRDDYQSLLPLTIYEYDRSNSNGDLAMYCQNADFVFNLAGVNRPKDPAEFTEGNKSFVSKLLGCLEANGNACPVMLSSSQQATLEGRFEGSVYGQSKLEGEVIAQKYSESTGAPILIYRFPNLYGKWCRPNYNSAVATFCHNIANGLPVQINDPSVELELLHIDDLVAEMLRALIGRANHVKGSFYSAEPHTFVTVGEIVNLLVHFERCRDSLQIPDVTEGSFSKKLYSTFVSYLEPVDLAYRPKTNADARGSFTELFKSTDRGQVSVNISRPGVTKGQHWHHTKFEKFCVVSGEGVIQLRKVGTGAASKPDEIVEYHVSGEEITVIDIIPGYTHNIINLSQTQNLVTIMWCNEIFGVERPDTYGLEV